MHNKFRDQLRGQINDKSDNDSLLYAGDLQDPIPRGLIVDRRISPGAFRLWCYLRSQVTAQYKEAVCPSYDQIASEIGVGSHETISRSFHYLRLGRWMTLIGRKKSSIGRNIGSIYTLHSEPAELNEVLSIDDEYSALVTKMSEAKDKGLRDLATHIQTEFSRPEQDQNDLSFGLMGKRFNSVMEHRSELSALFNESEKADYEIRSGENEQNRPDYENRSGLSEPNYENRSGLYEISQADYENRSHCSSSLNNNKTTTTNNTNTIETTNFGSLDFHDSVLGFPEFVKQNLAKKLNTISAELRQLVINEVLAKEKTGKAKNPAGMIIWYCDQISKAPDDAFTFLTEYMGSLTQTKREQVNQDRTDQIFIAAEQEHEKRIQKYLKASDQNAGGKQ